MATSGHVRPRAEGAKGPTRHEDVRAHEVTRM